MPVLRRSVQRCTKALRRLFDRSFGIRRKLCADHRHAFLDNARLFRGDLRKRVAKEFDVIHPDGGDDAGQRLLDHIGRIQPSAKPDFQQHDIRRMPREQIKRRSRLDFEDRDGFACIDAFAMIERVAQLVIGHKNAAADLAEAEALVETHQMRRRIGVNAQARCLQNGAEKRHGRSLAVGPGNMNDRRDTSFGMIETLKNAPHPVEREIDPLGMKRSKTRQNVVVGRRRFLGRRRCHAGDAVAGRSTGSDALRDSKPSAGGALVSKRQIRANVARKSWRCTTISTMPCSFRYSAR